MITTSLVGSFYFTYQGYGCISGLYHNTGHIEPHPETAKRNENRPDSSELADNLQGAYRTIWLEAGRKDSCDLKIERLPDNTFSLLWSKAGTVYFKGIGFVSDNKLVGSFWEP